MKRHLALLTATTAALAFADAGWGGDASAWQGAYAGATAELAFGDNDISTHRIRDLHLGYRWQRRDWVYGPELGFGFGDAKDGGRLPELRLNALLSLRLRAGYLLGPAMMVFGSAGALRGDFDHRFEQATETHDASGYSVGLGVERRFTDRLSLSAEWQYRNFGETRISVRDADSIATAATDHHNLRLGLNFRF